MFTLRRTQGLGLLLFGCVLAFITWHDTRSYGLQKRTSEAHVPVQATILTATLHRGRATGGNAALWTPQIRYRYHVAGRTFTAYRDPADPSLAVVWRQVPERGYTDAIFAGLWLIDGTSAVMVYRCRPQG